MNLIVYYLVLSSHRVSLAACDNNMPQCGFDDVESADVPYLQPVLPAELHPARSNMITTVAVHDATNLPRPAAIG